MHSFLDAKAMAKVLRQALATQGTELAHAESLELVAHQFGLPNWNVLAARIEAASADKSTLPLPEGWSITNLTDQRFYRLGLDPAEPGTALIESRLARGGAMDVSKYYGVFVQTVSARRYHSQRLRLSASLRTQDADRAALWMRVDRASGDVLRFDNMLDRRKDGPLRGTQGWTTASVVLDVPTDAASVLFGFLLEGYGQVRARGFQLEVVGEDIQPTAGWGRWLAEPTNLDFAG
jgi:hypothetical protein